jgi:ribosome recycling factor
MSLFLDRETAIIAHFQEELKSIRTGRVNASILDNIQVEAYGTMMHIKELATVTSPEPAQLLITPFDKTVNNAIEKAITLANIGANPGNDGAGIRLNFPPLTEENRKLRAKEVDKLLEASKVQVRLNRQEAFDIVKKQKSDGEMGEDDYKRAEHAIQMEVDHINKKLDELAAAKREELMKM